MSTEYREEISGEWPYRGSYEYASSEVVGTGIFAAAIRIVDRGFFFGAQTVDHRRSHRRRWRKRRRQDRRGGLLSRSSAPRVSSSRSLCGGIKIRITMPGFFSTTFVSLISGIGRGVWAPEKPLQARGILSCGRESSLEGPSGGYKTIVGPVCHSPSFIRYWSATRVPGGIPSSK